MASITRRRFAAALLAAAPARPLSGAASVDEILRDGIARRRIPCAVAMAATSGEILYSGAFGLRDSSGPPVTPGSIFAIASMTKAITTAAVMQLVEQGKLGLDEPVSKHLPRLARLEVLEGFSLLGKPIFRPARSQVTLKHLLTHTSGFAYDIWDEKISTYYRRHGLGQPLVFDPGTRWRYGPGLDWAGRLVEKLTGQNLDAYFRANIFDPLGMTDTAFLVPAEKFSRLVGNYFRSAGGALQQDRRDPPRPPRTFSGGGGLYGTAPDYIRFMQMILRNGAAPNGRRILRARTVDLMSTNQIGDLSAGKLRSTSPRVSADVDFHPGFEDKYTFGFLLNPDPHPGGRSAGSLSWAGINNTFYWIDPRRNLCAVLMMQFLPFCDSQAVGLLRDFERAVYANLV
ncbi:MAG TPA: serine hydrolase domain-containing protein [Bryobacteraceae bacterium]|nr:serine hydrolase domain-containing protein [Bryobacteraceae bacterium]